MREEFDYQLTCRVFRSDIGDVGQLLHRIADWIEANNVAVQDITTLLDDERTVVAVYYIRKAEAL